MNNGLLVLRRLILVKKPMCTLMKMAIFMNMADKNARFRESETTLINTLETDKQIQVRAKKFCNYHKQKHRKPSEEKLISLNK